MEDNASIHPFPKKKKRWTQIGLILPVLFALFLLFAICFPFILLGLSVLQAIL